MKTNVLLISPEKLRGVTTMSENLDDCYIQPCIIDAQLVGLQSVIGTPLYDKLCRLVEGNTLNEPKNSIYKEFVDVYVECYLVYQTQVEMVVQSMSRQHNAGNVSYIDTSYQHTPTTDVKYLKDYYSNKASFFAERMLDFLHQHSDMIPEWKSSTYQLQGDDRANTYRCGIKL